MLESQESGAHWDGCWSQRHVHACRGEGEMRQAGRLLAKQTGGGCDKQGGGKKWL